MKIKALSLTDFRAIPGPAPTTFELDGKNLLAYGENGSGKSSLFKTLSGFFAYGPPPRLRDRGLLEKQGAGSRTHYILANPVEAANTVRAASGFQWLVTGRSIELAQPATRQQLTKAFP